ncbi:MAG: hypothetical protein IBJ11_07965 [Phycisphaerales bacterium]|nr:hypothetical protein [Phycisphaerales bacterium]
MYWYSWLLIAVFVLGVGAIALVSNLIEASTGVWKRIAERFPAQPAEPDASGGFGSVRLLSRAKFEAMNTRIGCLGVLMRVLFLPFYVWQMAGGGEFQIRWSADSGHLHLEYAPGTSGSLGRLAGAAAMSLPWGMMEPIARGPGGLGEVVAFAIDSFVVIVPLRMAELELEVRRHMGGAPESGGAPAGASGPA